jgi:hypothetical protein
VLVDAPVAHLLCNYHGDFLSTNGARRREALIWSYYACVPIAPLQLGQSEGTEHACVPCERSVVHEARGKA